MPTKPLSFAVILIATALVPIKSNAQWLPTGPLLSIPQTTDCSMTGGDIAVARPNGIFNCPSAAQMVNSLVPDAGHFYFVHEYGHLAIPTSSEPAADCWAAQQLSAAPNGPYYVKQWITFWSQHGQSHPNYGTQAQRIANVRACCACGA